MESMIEICADVCDVVWWWWGGGDCQLLPLPLPWSLGACWAKDRTKRVIFISNINIMGLLNDHNSVVLKINDNNKNKRQLYCKS